MISKPTHDLVTSSSPPSESLPLLLPFPMVDFAVAAASSGPEEANNKGHNHNQESDLLRLSVRHKAEKTTGHQGGGGGQEDEDSMDEIAQAYPGILALK